MYICVQAGATIKTDVLFYKFYIKIYNQVAIGSEKFLYVQKPICILVGLSVLL